MHLISLVYSPFINLSRVFCRGGEIALNKNGHKHNSRKILDLSNVTIETDKQTWQEEVLAPNYFLAPMTVSYRRTSISKLHHTMARKPTDEAATCNLRRSLSVGKYGENGNRNNRTLSAMERALIIICLQTDTLSCHIILDGGKDKYYEEDECLYCMNYLFFWSLWPGIHTRPHLRSKSTLWH